MTLKHLSNAELIQQIRELVPPEGHMRTLGENRALDLTARLQAAESERDEAKILLDDAVRDRNRLRAEVERLTVALKSQQPDWDSDYVQKARFAAEQHSDARRAAENRADLAERRLADALREVLGVVRVCGGMQPDRDEAALLDSDAKAEGR